MTTDRAWIRDILSESHGIFSSLSAEQLDTMLDLAQLRAVKARDRVCVKDQPGEEFYIILSGKLKVSTQSDDGREAIIAFLEEGQLFGEMSLIDGRPRSADVTAIQAAELLVIHRRDFLQFLHGNPDFCVSLLTELTHRLRMTDSHLEDLRFLDLKTRLAKALYRLALEHGRTTAVGSVRLDIRLSQEELGSLVSATRESVNKQIKAWETEGVMTSRQNGILIHRLDELKQLTRGPTIL